ncbi:hypothetical protein [Kribbella sp. HUAS MG21]|uniref:Uncharacterized protein n=1 Tax=Kribbella sp. HUAS MG21 TaxID=3160966 RepID=A0AAU7TLU0_9ACTN
MSMELSAAELADQVHNAVASVRVRLGRAVECAEELDQVLWETENALRDLPVRPQGELTEGERSSALSTGAYQAREINTLVRRAQNELDGVREQLDAAGSALTQAKGYLDEFDQFPGTTNPERQVTSADLRKQLTGLETAIATADAGAGRTADRLGAARTNIGKIVPVHGEERNRNVALVYEAGEAVTKDLSGLQAGLGAASSAHTRAVQSAATADDLANAVRAAANPTPASARQTPASSSAQDHRDRTAKAPRDQQLKR